jgi:hypothetical protein
MVTKTEMSIHEAGNHFRFHRIVARTPRAVLLELGRTGRRWIPVSRIHNRQWQRDGYVTLVCRRAERFDWRLR